LGFVLFFGYERAHIAPRSQKKKLSKRKAFSSSFKLRFLKGLEEQKEEKKKVFVSFSFLFFPSRPEQAGTVCQIASRDCRQPAQKKKESSFFFPESFLFLFPPREEREKKERKKLPDCD